MPEGIVDILETIEIEKQQRQLLGLALTLSNGLLEPFEKHATIGQFGQWIEISQSADLLYGFAALGSCTQSLQSKSQLSGQLDQQFHLLGIENPALICINSQHSQAPIVDHQGQGNTRKKSFSEGIRPQAGKNRAAGNILTDNRPALPHCAAAWPLAMRIVAVGHGMTGEKKRLLAVKGYREDAACFVILYQSDPRQAKSPLLGNQAADLGEQRRFTVGLQQGMIA